MNQISAWFTWIFGLLFLYFRVMLDVFDQYNFFGV